MSKAFVYVVLEGCGYDGFEIEGIFSNDIKAYDKMLQLTKDNENLWLTKQIQEDVVEMRHGMHYVRLEKWKIQ